MDNQKLISATELFRNAWKIFLEHWKTLVRIAVLPLAATFLFWLILYIFQIDSPEHFKFTLPYILGFGIAFLALFFVSLLTQVALIEAVHNRAESVSVKGRLLTAWKRIYVYAGVSVLQSLIVGVGFVLLVIPGLIYAVRYFFSGYSVVLDDQKGISALNFSKNLVQGHWGEVFWKLVFMGLVALLLYIPFAVIGNATGHKAVGDFLGSLVTLIITPLSTVYIYLLYQNLKSVKNPPPPPF